MTPAEALAGVRAAGVDVTLDGDELRLRASPGVLTPERLDWLRAHRDALVEALRPARYPETNDPAVDFYRELFEGQAARALVSLEPEHVDRAVDLGVLDLALAERSVVLAFRKLGIAGVLIAVPRERYDGLGVLQSFDATTAP
jgi:hypothetical protein